MAVQKYLTYPASVVILSSQLVLALAGLTARLQAQSPVGHWTFNDGSGTTAADSSGNGRAASLANGASWVAGQISDAVSANAAKQQYVSIPPLDLSGTRAVTVTLWSNRTYSTGGGHVLFEDSADFNNSTTGFGLFPDDATCNGIQVALRGNVGPAANCYSQPSSGVWHHLAVIFDKSRTGGNEIRFYVDGVLQTVNLNLYASTNTNNFGNNPIYLFSQAGTSGFDSGSVGDLRIYNSALTTTEIRQIYNSGILVSLAVSPANPSIAVRTQQQFSTTIQATSGSISGSTTLTVTGQHFIALAWTASTSPRVVGYNAYRSLTTNGPYTKLNSTLIATTSYNDQTVQIGITYYYVTTAVNSQGLESAYSNQAAATVHQQP